MYSQLIIVGKLKNMVTDHLPSSFCSSGIPSEYAFLVALTVLNLHAFIVIMSFGKVKLSLCLIKHYAMKAYGGVDV
jgi:hypothetical protein